MILDKSNKLLEKLRKTNYRQIPDFGMDAESEMIIKTITNECKSTILISKNVKRYGSDIIIENLHEIIRQLIINGGTIPKEVMNGIMFSKGIISGVNSDINLYKGIRENEDGSMESTATIGNSVIDLVNLNSDTKSLIEREVYDRFARHFILSNTKNLPRVNKFSIFKEKILHGREDREFIKKQFVSILRNETKYNDTIINATADYHLNFMYNDKFKSSILEAANSGSTLVPIEEKGKNVSFDQLLKSISVEVQDIANYMIPDINMIHSDITQAYHDVEAQLIAYSTDITKLDVSQIEDIIKQVNKASLKNPDLQKHLGNSGYRQINVGISGNSVKMVDNKDVPTCMQKLSEDIHYLVQNASSLDREDYLKKAVQLSYRFIRIHPFSDSNGRTSRALLNMMTIPKGILINIPKEIKSGFVQSQRETNERMDELGYFEVLSNNDQNLEQIENDTIDSPYYQFIKQNCTIDVKDLYYSRDDKENEVVLDKNISEIKEDEGQIL